MANSNNSNKKLVPEAMDALEKFKYEVASEVGVNLKNGYNGNNLLDIISRKVIMIRYVF